MHYINGNWLAGEGAVIESIDPAKNTVIWSGKAASPAQINNAIDAARSAFSQWGSLSVDTRIEHVLAYAEQLKANQDLLAQTIAIETGKPLWETATEAAAMVGSRSSGFQPPKALQLARCFLQYRRSQHSLALRWIG